MNTLLYQRLLGSTWLNLKMQTLRSEDQPKNPSATMLEIIDLTTPSIIHSTILVLLHP